MNDLVNYLRTQTLLTLTGSIFAWYTTVKNFIAFYKIEGTIFKIQDCIIPNPVTESCFYGAIAFALAFLWSLWVFTNHNQVKAIKGQHYLWWFISAGTIFAWCNVAKEFTAFYTSPQGAALGCSANLITNPFLTPCFFGATIFFITAVVAGITYSKLKTKHR